MTKILIINAGQDFDESGGKFNQTITNWTKSVLKEKGFEIRISETNEDYDVEQEIENFTWADVIVFHTPIWWFQVPFKLKQYIDFVFQKGRGTIYKSDGRTRENPEINYGTGGLLQGRKYLVTTTWNAPEGAFTIENEFMDQTSVDDGVLFGFHKAMKFVGLEKLDGFHFYDVAKGLTDERLDVYEKNYKKHLNQVL